MTTDPTATAAAAATGKLQMHVTATLLDGTVLDTHPGSADMMRYELHAHSKGWPAGATDLPFVRAAFCAWAWAKRRQLTALSWERFYDQLDDLDLSGDDTDPAGPQPL